MNSMRVAKLVDMQMVVEGYKTEPLFVIKCPWCGHLNEEKYWVLYCICEKCGRISILNSKDVDKMRGHINSILEL